MEEREPEVVLEKPALFGMIMNPRIQFERIRENPKILVAILVVTFLTLIGTFMMFSGMDVMLESDPALQGFGEDELLFVTLIAQITGIIVGVFTPVITILIATVVFIIIAKIVRSEVTFKQLFSMNTYIFLISALSMLLNGLLFMVIQGGNPEILFTSLNSVIGAEGVLGAVFNSIEVFSIWGLILTGIGLQVVAKFSKGLSWSIVIAFYIISLVFTIVGAALGSLGI